MEGGTNEPEIGWPNLSTIQSRVNLAWHVIQRGWRRSVSVHVGTPLRSIYTVHIQGGCMLDFVLFYDKFDFNLLGVSSRFRASTGISPVSLWKIYMTWYMVVFSIKTFINYVVSTVNYKTQSACYSSFLLAVSILFTTWRSCASHLCDTLTLTLVHKMKRWRIFSPSSVSMDQRAHSLTWMYHVLGHLFWRP